MAAEPSPGRPRVTHVPSPAPHGCFTPLLGMWNPSPWGNQPPQAAGHGYPQRDGILLSFLPSFCPNFFILPSAPSPFLLFPVPGQEQPRSASGFGGRSCPCPLSPVLRPPHLCCCRTWLFAPPHPSAVCGVPSALPCTPTPPQPLQCPARLRVRCSPPTYTDRGALYTSGCNPPPRRPSDALHDLGYDAIPLHALGCNAALPPPAMPWMTRGSTQSPHKAVSCVTWGTTQHTPTPQLRV